MKFRHHLAKETFKGKKKDTEQGVEDLISEDQRGNQSSAGPNILSLDEDTITPEPVKEEPKEMSRRDMFSFGNFLDFGTAVEDEARKKNPENLVEDIEDEEPKTLAEPDPAEEAEKIEESTPEKGFFKRLLLKFKSAPEEELSVQPEPETQPDRETEPTQEPAEVSTETDATASDNIVEEEAEDPEYDRRNLLRQGVHFFAKPAVDKVQSKIDGINKVMDKITKRVPLLRPPGAISERKFLQACSHCDECIHACPKDAILRAPKKMGFLVFNTPYIDPLRNPCVMCVDLPCISACPDKALLPVQELTDVSMGYAILDKKKCQAYGDTFCQQCVIDCPIPGAIHQVSDKPIINKNICTGCGVCMRSCSTVNIPLAIKIKPQMVIESQLHKKQQELVRIEVEQRIEAEQRVAEQEETEDGEGRTNSTNPEL